jgi:hypothetical protein
MSSRSWHLLDALELTMLIARTPANRPTAKAHTGFEPVSAPETLYEPLQRKLEQFRTKTEVPQTAEKIPSGQEAQEGSDSPALVHPR